MTPYPLARYYSGGSKPAVLIHPAGFLIGHASTVSEYTTLLCVGTSLVQTKEYRITMVVLASLKALPTNMAISPQMVRRLASHGFQLSLLVQREK